MEKILFIYGYGGNTTSVLCELLRENLKSEYDVRCYEYPQKDCARAKEYLEQIVKDEDIDIIVGASLGGFVTLALEIDKPKVVINPCMRPSVELPLLKPRPDHPDDVAPSAEMIATYAPYEDAVNAGKQHEHKNPVIGLFGQNDELFGTKYFKPFLDAYGDARLIPGTHHDNKKAIPTIVSVINFDCGSFIIDGKTKVFNGRYSGAIYELCIWEKPSEESEPSDEDIITEMRENGCVVCANYDFSTGFYNTRERAEQALGEWSEWCFDVGVSIDFALIRQRVSYCQMNPSDYVKEWSYNKFLKAVDETLVRNYALKENPFLGRPEEMIRLKIGDIVKVFCRDSAYWGIVYALPFTPKEVSKKKDFPFDYTDDCYIILTDNTGYDSHEHVPSHRVIKPYPTEAPLKVRELLEEGLAKALHE